MGGCGLLGGLRHRFLLLGLVNGRIPHRGQQSSGLPIFDHHHGVASGIVFFSEVLGIEKLVGGAVILVGIYLARRQ